MRTIKILLICLLLLPQPELKAQEGGEGIKHQRLTLVMSNAHVPSGLDNDGNNKWLVLSSWGLDYDWRFNDRWAISVQSDIVIENFRVMAFESNPKEALRRSYPLALALAGMYSATEHLSLIAGAGIDIAKEESIPLWRLGLEYGWEINDTWEISLNLVYDNKIEAYDTWSFGVAGSYCF